jgi:hypothetical protein
MEIPKLSDLMAIVKQSSEVSGGPGEGVGPRFPASPFAFLSC